MDYVATKSINYVEGFKVVLGESQFMWEYRLVIRGMQKCISAVGETLWLAIVDTTGGPGKLRKTQRAQGNRGLQQTFQGKIKNDQDGWSW